MVNPYPHSKGRVYPTMDSRHSPNCICTNAPLNHPSAHGSVHVPASPRAASKERRHRPAAAVPEGPLGRGVRLGAAGFPWPGESEQQESKSPSCPRGGQRAQPSAHGGPMRPSNSIHAQDTKTRRDPFQWWPSTPKSRLFLCRCGPKHSF